VPDQPTMPNVTPLKPPTARPRRCHERKRSAVVPDDPIRSASSRAMARVRISGAPSAACSTLPCSESVGGKRRLRGSRSSLARKQERHRRVAAVGHDGSGQGDQSPPSRAVEDAGGGGRQPDRDVAASVRTVREHPSASAISTAAGAATRNPERMAVCHLPRNQGRRVRGPSSSAQGTPQAERLIEFLARVGSGSRPISGIGIKTMSETGRKARSAGDSVRHSPTNRSSSRACTRGTS